MSGLLGQGGRATVSPKTLAQFLEDVQRGIAIRNIPNGCLIRPYRIDGQWPDLAVDLLGVEALGGQQALHFHAFVEGQRAILAGPLRLNRSVPEVRLQLESAGCVLQKPTGVTKSVPINTISRARNILRGVRVKRSTLEPEEKPTGMCGLARLKFVGGLELRSREHPKAQGVVEQNVALDRVFVGPVAACGRVH